MQSNAEADMGYPMELSRAGWNGRSTVKDGPYSWIPSPFTIVFLVLLYVELA